MTTATAPALDFVREMTHPQEWRQWPEDDRHLERLAALYALCVKETIAGQPRRMVETFFQIPDRVGSVGTGLTPFKLTENQEYYYKECFTGRTHILSPMNVVVDKARRAYASTFWQAMEFAAFLSKTNWNILLFAHRNDVAQDLMRNFDYFWDSLPPILKSGIEVGHWADNRKEIGFPDGSRNTIRSYSAQAQSVPAGGQAQALHFSEGSKYAEAYYEAMMTAVRPMLVRDGWRIWETTRQGMLYPSGRENPHYSNVRALEEGGRGILLRRYWYQDRANALPPGHGSAVSGTEGDFELTEEERVLADRFPKDGVPVLDRIRWRRAQLEDYRIFYGNPKRGKAMFLQENLEDNASGWANADKTPFDIDLCTRYAKSVQPLYEDRTTADGIVVQELQGPLTGADYGAGMDSASGRKDGDYTSVSIVDAGNGRVRTHVVRLIGRVNPKSMTAVALPYLERYNDPLFGPEVTGGWGESAVQALKDTAYRRLYKRPIRQDESWEHWAREPYGFQTTQASKNRILQALVDDFNNGEFVTYFPDTLRMLMNYDPTNTEAHTPDELISLAIANEMAKDPRVWTKRRGTGVRTRTVFGGADVAKVTPGRYRGWAG